MMEAVYAASRKLGDAIVYKEHKIKDKAGVVAMMKLGVSNVPTIVIDGKISFISIIPDESTFMQVLKDAMQAKGLET
jgi:predicted DsbA family dithiol-disulfide isomerase